MAKTNQIALVRCADYELTTVEAAVRRSIDLLGGMAVFVRPGQRVLLKPNLLRAVSPERAATTHPSVVAAVAKLVIEAGGRPIIVESPGGPYSPALLRLTYRNTRMNWAAEVSGAELNLNVESVQVSYPEGKLLHRLDLLQPLTEANVVINLAKLKTHNLSTLTLAAKNLFGLVPGAIKIGYHAKLRNTRLFCEGLVDIAAYVKPQLNLIDAVVGMEGNGPSGGDPRPIGALLAGADVFAVDVAASALVNFDPLTVGTTQVAMERGLTSGRAEDLEWLGDTLESLRVRDFRRGTAAAVDPGLLPKRLLSLAQASGTEGEGDGHKQSLFGRLATGWLAQQLVTSPRAGEKCIGCGYCAKHCPVGAITMVGKLARMDAQKCIRCYCCHELCPELAVELYRPWLGRVLLGS